MDRRTFLQTTALSGMAAAPVSAAEALVRGGFHLQIPSVHTSSRLINTAYRIAVGDLAGNVALFQSGLLEEPVPVLLAGLGYDTPWTRDAAVNAWNGVPLLMPEVSRNTLMAVLERVDGAPRIIGASQYWDAIVWATGAWHHYLLTGDRPFLALAFQAVGNSLAFYEDTEFDPADGLFRGPGWSDGGINTWPRFHPDQKASRGYGIPMKALSTNCLYYNGYRVQSEMAAELGRPVDPAWRRKADRLREAINFALWSEERKHYRFLTGPFGNCDHQGSLGHAYALLFGVSPEERTAAVLRNQYVAPAGVPCLWPNFERYSAGFGRHAGTIWPQIQGMWSHAAARSGSVALFRHELMQLAGHAVRDRQYAEIYHPISGEIYGGLQERGGRGIVLWDSQPRQSWAASAFLRMLFSGLLGMEPSREGVQFTPCVPAEVSETEIRNLRIRGCRIDVTMRGTGVGSPQPMIPWSRFEQPQISLSLEIGDRR